MPFSLKQIKYFVAAAEAGQVSNAANHLHISQSAVTSAIQELEKILGVTLFNRSTQGVILTDNGRHFLNHAYSILAVVDEALTSPLPDDNVQGVIRLGASRIVMGYFLPYHLARLSHQYPNLTIELFEQSRVELQNNLIQGQLDLAVLLTSNIDSHQIAYETLVHSSRYLWLPSGHPLTQKEVVSFSDIADQPYINLNVDEAEQVAEHYWAQHHHPLNAILTTCSIEAVRSMVANGAAITILSDTVYRPWSLEGKRIIKKSLVPSVPLMHIGVAWFKEAALSPAQRAVLGYFKQAFSLYGVN